MKPGAGSGGSCFDFEIHSTLSFAYLRGGKGETLSVTLPSEEVESSPGQLLYDWLPRAGRLFHARLYQDRGLFRFWVDGMGSFLIDPEGRRILLPEVTDTLQREERLWGIPTALCLLHRGDLPIHAAAVEVDGAGVLLGAPGRFGKSTLAAAFHLAGHRVLSEDLSCARLSAAVSVIPGPAMLRVRQDVMSRLMFSGARVVGGDDDRVSLAVDEARRGTCRPVPLHAVVLLRESENHVTLARVPAAQAIPDLWSLCFRLPTADGRARSFGGVVDLAKRVPTWDLTRALRLEDLSETVDRIVDTCVRGG